MWCTTLGQAVWRYMSMPDKSTGEDVLNVSELSTLSNDMKRIHEND
jgi:hypothetical protein